MASTTVASQIRLNSKLYHASTVGLSGVSSEIVNGKQFVEAPYFPVFSTTTGTSNRLVVGDWANFAVVRRQGITVEVVPTVVGAATFRPTG
jgi:predicted phage gp36 major capsid-like protein